jgi:hypothetical protein
VWGSASHLLLRMGGARRAWSKTIETFAYACTPLALSPMLSCLWFMAWLGGVWAAVLAVVMLRQRQQVGLGLAVTAVLVPPALLILLGVSALVWVIWGR